MRKMRKKYFKKSYGGPNVGKSFPTEIRREIYVWKLPSLPGAYDIRIFIRNYVERNLPNKQKAGFRGNPCRHWVFLVVLWRRQMRQAAAVMSCKKNKTLCDPASPSSAAAWRCVQLQTAVVWPRPNRRFTRQANPRLQDSHHGDIPAGDQNLPAGIKSVHGLFASGCTHLRALLQLWGCEIVLSYGSLERWLFGLCRWVLIPNHHSNAVYSPDTRGSSGRHPPPCELQPHVSLPAGTWQTWICLSCESPIRGRPQLSKVFSNP